MPFWSLISSPTLFCIKWIVLTRHLWEATQKNVYSYPHQELIDRSCESCFHRTSYFRSSLAIESLQVEISSRLSKKETSFRSWPCSSFLVLIANWTCLNSSSFQTYSLSQQFLSLKKTPSKPPILFSDQAAFKKYLKSGFLHHIFSYLKVFLFLNLKPLQLLTSNNIGKWSKIS